jgi:hypothetical protein
MNLPQPISNAGISVSSGWINMCCAIHSLVLVIYTFHFKVRMLGVHALVRIQAWTNINNILTCTLNSIPSCQPASLQGWRRLVAHIYYLPIVTCHLLVEMVKPRTQFSMLGHVRVPIQTWTNINNILTCTLNSIP